ncbi:MAG TPA: AAA-like domain-containing protein [Ktedonobacteraceae bacterium]|nr:AAA-like domain-containing protein [Ktedonobacteraceae bacterium]
MAPLTDSKRRNPYGQLTAIRSAELFFGREQELELLYNALLDRQSVAIIGQRRIGKSSLLLCCCLPEVQRRVGIELNEHLLIVMNLEEHLQRAPEDFFAIVCEQLLQQSQLNLSLETLRDTGGDRFSQLLNLINLRGLHPVLLLDEFDSIVRNPQFNPDFFSFLRAQANAGKVSYVTASFSPLDQISHSAIVGSPFFNIFSYHNLGPLSEEAAKALIMEPAKAVGCPFTEREVQFVLEVAGCHPFYIQRACYFLFHQKSQLAGKMNLQRLASQIYEDLLPHFTYAWEHLDVDKREQLRREAIRKDSQQRKLPELSESALLRKFVRDKTKIATGHLTIEYLRRVLDRLDDFTFLGECHLSNFSIIYGAEQDKRLTAAERGLRVYKLLEDALSQLRPTGTHSLTSPEWQMHTVLQSCYFKRDRRSNKQLASYLGMSERDFYRKRDDAVNALLNILLKMEAAYIDELEA